MANQLNRKFIPPITTDMIGQDLYELINQSKGYALLSLLVNKSVMTGLYLSSDYSLDNNKLASFNISNGEYVYLGAYYQIEDTGSKTVDGDTSYQVVNGLITETKFGRKDYLIGVDCAVNSIVVLGGELAKQGEAPKRLQPEDLPSNQIALYYFTVDGTSVGSTKIFDYTKSNAEIWTELQNKVNKDFIQQFILQLNEIKSTLEEQGIANFINQYENGYYNIFKDTSEVDMGQTTGFVIANSEAKLMANSGTLKIADLDIQGGFNTLDLYVYLNNNLSVLSNDGLSEGTTDVLKLKDLGLVEDDVIFIDNKPFKVVEVIG